MKMNKWIIAAAVASLLRGSTVGAPDTVTVREHRDRYDVAREVTLVGTVASYTTNSAAAPFGPWVSLLTSSGAIDVHLGDARLLTAKPFTIQSGDTLRIIGEDVTLRGTTQFVARIVQNGTRAITVRSTRGFPLSDTGSGDSADARAKQGAAR